MNNKHHPNPHSKFFSSLQHLEKRLKLDYNTNHSPSSQSLFTSPLFLHQPNNPSTTHFTQSQTPLEFFSNPTSSPQPQQNDADTDADSDTDADVDSDVDEVGLLVDLLGLSIPDDGMDTRKCCSCHCDGGFYDKIVGVKGPKCMNEVERINGWIRSLTKDRVEPFRLAHLLLGKASYGHSFDGVEFPSTVHEFLQLDPPLTKDM